MSVTMTDGWADVLNGTEVHPQHFRGWRIYRNLHKQTFSIQTYVKGKGWRVIGHGDGFLAQDVEFKVYENGRQRALREGSKNVHAFAIAQRIVTRLPPCFEPVNPFPISYSPFAEPPLGSDGVGSFFIDGPHLAIDRADSVLFTEGGELVGIRRP